MGRLIFLAPIAGLLAGVIGFAIVSLLYMLKLRRRPVSVSSTLLWSRAVRDMEGNVPFQRISPTGLFVIHLLIVLLLSLAIARPVFDDAIGDGQRVYLVVDTSASMNAQVDGRTGLDIAKEVGVEKVKELFNSGRRPIVSVIEAGHEPRALIVDSSERGRLIGVIRSITGTDQAGRLEDAIEMVESIEEASRNESDQEEGAREGGTDLPAYVFVMSDGGSVRREMIPMRGGAGVSRSPFVDDAMLKNIGIVAISGTRDRSDPVFTRLFVRLVRSSEEVKAGVVQVFDGETLITSRAVEFEAEDSINVSFELRLMRSALLRVEIAGDDALLADNQAWVSMPDPSPVRISVVAPGGIADPLLVDMLEVVGRTDVAELDVDDPIGDVDLVVYDRVRPSGWVDRASIGFGSLYPDQDDSDQLETLGSRRRMLSWDRADAVVRDSSLGSVSYQRSVRLPDEVDGVRVLARDRDGGVIVERVHGSHRHLRVAFGLQDSNWAVQVGFPIFLVNAIERLLPGTSGVGEVYSTADRIEADGDSEAVGPFDRVGGYEVGGQRVGVGLLNESESLLRVNDGIVIGIDGQGRDGGLGVLAERELWRWFTLFAVVLIVLEGFVYAAKVRIRI